MKVVLLQKVKNLGEAGDALEVANGYAMNMLIPQKLAEKATVANLAAAEKIRAERMAKHAEIVKDAQKYADKLAKITLKFTRKTSKGDKLFGAVTEKDIMEAIAEQAKISLEKKQVKMKHHIKEIGKYEIEIHLVEDINAKVKVEIAAEK